ncbi:MAG: hypothetical protein AAF497_29640, partial [Planctomycetota bacterium]
IDLDSPSPINSVPVAAGITDKKTAQALLNGVYDGLQSSGAQNASLRSKAWEHEAAFLAFFCRHR